MFTLRIRFETFWTVPVIASSAPRRLASCASQPPQACRLLACASLATGAMSTSANRPEFLQPQPQLIAQVAKARLFVGARALDLPLHAGVDQFEIETTATVCACAGACTASGSSQDTTRQYRSRMRKVKRPRIGRI